jgi:hypothetical protein
VLGDRAPVGAGGVGDRDALAGRGFDVDVVVAGPAAAEDLEVRRGCDDVGGEGVGARDDPVDVPDDVGQRPPARRPGRGRGVDGAEARVGEQAVDRTARLEVRGRDEYAHISFFLLSEVRMQIL